MGRSGNGGRLGAVVEALCARRELFSRGSCAGHHRELLPSRSALLEMVEELRAVLFPGYFTDWDLSQGSLHYYLGATLDHVLHGMQEQIKRAICLSGAVGHEDARERAMELTRAFLERLPEVRRLLGTDVEAAYEGDPAAQDVAEVVFAYPGLAAITVHRLAHELYRLGVPLIPRIISEHAHSRTGVDIHPGASIDERFFIDHGTGVVVGETTVIGKRVRLYQGVTLGAKSFPLDEHGQPIKGIARHPIVEDEAIIYGGATILGRVTIGRGSVIGGNVWLTRSVPPGSVVTQIQAREILFQDGGGI